MVLIPPTRYNISLSYKLEFDATNNVIEYEPLTLGLKTTHKNESKESSNFWGFRISCWDIPTHRK